jgi:N-acetylglutamate synthase-like GNAT family acetyltransferase
MAVEVREAMRGDQAAITDLLRELGYPTRVHVVAERLDRLERDPASWMWVASDGGRVVGLAALHVMPLVQRGPLGRLTAIVVGDGARRRGVGRALIGRVEQRARAEGCESMEVTTADRRSEAHAFYAELGFEQASRRFLKRF